MAKNVIEIKAHICLKFGKEKFMTNFIKDGEIYFNTLGLLSKHPDSQIGDSKEGFIRIPITDVSVVEIDGLVLNVEGVSFEYNDTHNKNVFCLYILDDERVENGVNSKGYFQFRLDEYYSDDWTHCVIIRNIKEFHKRITDKITEAGYKFNAAAITYTNIADSSIAFNHFTKDLKYKSQNEWRFLIEDTDNKPITLHLGNLEDIASLCPVSKEQVIYIGPFKKINNGKTK